MTVTAKDLRFKTTVLFDALEKGEEIVITYRGKVKAKLVSAAGAGKETPKAEKDDLFGIWRDREDMDVEAHVRALRKGRSFAAEE
jgi:antitoxin (DNA-binding transcriptional repressor) of toxin-antitoxin stability system